MSTEYAWLYRAAGAGGKAGDCYKDCHRVQVDHSLTGMPGGASQNYAVPCDECHQDFDNASFHQENMFPMLTGNGVNPVTRYRHLNRYNTSSPLDPPRIPETQLHAQEPGLDEQYR